MPDAPVVTFPVGRTATLAMGLAVLVWVGWGLAFFVSFGHPVAVGKARPAIVLLVPCLIAAGACWRFWRLQVPRQLCWDGERWHLITAGAEEGGDGARVQVRLDAQRWMLLWFRAAGARRGTWLWAQASTAPQRWHLLRCALYLPQTSAAPGVDVERA